VPILGSPAKRGVSGVKGVDLVALQLGYLVVAEPSKLDHFHSVIVGGVTSGPSGRLVVGVRMSVMKQRPPRDPVLQMVDAVLCDLSVRSAMFVGCRAQDGDSKTFVIQTGEEGRRREYEELTWPQHEVGSLAPILSRRLERRGITGVVALSVRRTELGLVAEFGVPNVSSELTEALRRAAAPLPVVVREDPQRLIRAGPLSG
jgi:hypothetical protein